MCNIRPRVYITVSLLRHDLRLRLRLLSSSVDIDFPLECDDEFWESDDPNLAFNQPPGQPSTVAYFIFALKLRQILGLALRTIVELFHSNIAHN